MSSILQDIKKVLDSLKIPNETIVFSKTPPETYVVITPLVDDFEYADNKPTDDIQEVRLSLFTKTNYTKISRKILYALVDKDFTITSRKFVGFEEDTGYFHYAIDVENNYNFKED